MSRRRQLLDPADVLIVASASAEFTDLLRSLPTEKRIIDLVGLRPADDRNALRAEAHEGIAW